MQKTENCPKCNTTSYKRNTRFTCLKCGWKTVIEKDNNGKDIQIN